MKEQTNNYNDWDDQYYGTGPTEPPKSRGGVLAVMLILVIFLSGIVTVLGVLNIRLFRELKIKQKESDLTISFTTEATRRWLPPCRFRLHWPGSIARPHPPPMA